MRMGTGITSSLASVGLVALDTVREARSRGWILSILIGITLSLLSLAFGLEMEVVDGALAASKLFGDAIASDQIIAVDVALNYVLQAAAYVIFYGGLTLGILSSSDFAPSLLQPGRIEHMLSLPLRRAELLAGTYLGVLVISAIGVSYASVGFTAILAYKTKVLSLRLIPAALFGTFCFAGIYAVMMAAALFVRSASISAVTGIGIFVGGIIASYSDKISPMFSPGISRSVFVFVTTFLPPVATVANAAAAMAAGTLIINLDLIFHLAGILIFGGAILSAAIARFSRMDF